MVSLDVGRLMPDRKRIADILLARFGQEGVAQFAFQRGPKSGADRPMRRPCPGWRQRPRHPRPRAWRRPPVNQHRGIRTEQQATEASDFDAAARLFWNLRGPRGPGGHGRPRLLHRSGAGVELVEQLQPQERQVGQGKIGPRPGQFFGQECEVPRRLVRDGSAAPNR